MSEIAALAQLLADPDPGVAASLKRHLAERAEDPPGLRAAIEELPDPRERARAREARLEAGRERVADRLVALGGEPSLEEGACDIARLEDPDVDVAPARATLDELGRRASALAAAAPAGRERLLVLTRLLGDELGLEGDRAEENIPIASSLPLVLERRKGLPIALSVVYLLVAARAGIALHGVGAPLHFLVAGDVSAADVPAADVPAADVPGRTLWLDPFSRGRPLELDDVARLLRTMGVVFRPEHLAPTPPRAILARMARNLLSFHARRKQGEGRARRCARVAEALDGRL